jgi:hypothetical protein
MLLPQAVGSAVKGGREGMLLISPLANGKYSLMDAHGEYLSAATAALVKRTDCDPSQHSHCVDREGQAIHSCAFYDSHGAGTHGNSYCAIARTQSTRRRSWANDAKVNCRKTCRMCTAVEHGDDCPVEEYTVYRVSGLTIAVKSRQGRWLSFDGSKFSLTTCNPILNEAACGSEVFALRTHRTLITPKPTPAPQPPAPSVKLISCSVQQANVTTGELFRYHKFLPSECVDAVTGERGLPQGRCMVALRRTAACMSYDWAAQGPGEKQGSLFTEGKGAEGDCERPGGAAVSWTAVASDARCEREDVAVDFLCGSKTDPLPSTFTSCGRKQSVPRFKARRRRAKMFAVTFVGAECTHGVPRHNVHKCFASLHRARAGADSSVSKNDRWSVSLDRARVRHFGKQLSFDIQADYLCDIESRTNAIRAGSGERARPLLITVCHTLRYDHVLPKQAVYEGRDMSLFSVRFVERDCTNGVPAGNCVVGIRKAFGKAGWDYNWKAFGPNEQTYPGGPKGAGMSWMSHLLPSDLKSGSSFLVEVAASYVCDKAG